MMPTNLISQVFSIRDIVQNDESFELLRSLTKSINPALLRYLVQLELDTQRIDYVYSINRADATIIKFQLDSQRSSDFGQGLLAELTARQIPSDLIEKVTLDIWQIISLNDDCQSRVACETSTEVKEDINDVIQNLFPELVTPSAGDEPREDINSFEEFFEANNCIAAESELFDWLRPTYGIGFANTRIVNWTNSSNFSESFLVLDSSVLTYQYIGSATCPA